MRRYFVALMLLGCLCLASCSRGNDSMQAALDFRSKLLSAGGCSFVADVEADYGEKVYTFSLFCTYDGTNGHLTVRAPEEITGISASVTGATSEISFDGAVLEYGRLANGYIAPLSVPWLLPSAWGEDYILSSGQCEDGIAVTYVKGYNDEEITVTTILRDEQPVFAEVFRDGNRALAVEISQFTLNF